MRLFCTGDEYSEKAVDTPRPCWIKTLPEVQKDWTAWLQTLKGHSGSVHVIAFSPDGNKPASASDDRTVKVWDAGTGAAIQTLQGHSKSVRLLPSRRTASSYSSVGIKRRGESALWDVGRGAAIQTLQPSEPEILVFLMSTSDTLA